MENKVLFARYAELKQEEKELKAKLEELQPELMQAMKTMAVDKVYSDYGTFTIYKRKEWMFTDAVDLALKSVDFLKEQEKKTGVATYIENESIRFSAGKDEK